ncbi:MAG: hypothetical protein K6F58_05865 [Bacteroidales bacterium]|nr:hypothetical protein [Bacteroidales bacterium]
MSSCKILLAFTAAAVLAACVRIDPELGASMMPVSGTYKTVTPKASPLSVKQLMADSLSGFSSNRITIGAIRQDADYGLTTRSSVVSLVPLFSKKHDMGKNRKFISMHFAVALDTVSVENEAEKGILQSVGVYEASRPVDFIKDGNCNATFPHGTERVSDGVPVINGSDSLSFWFTKEFGTRYLDADQYMSSFAEWSEHYPGIYLDTPVPAGQGGRINLFELQLGYNSDYGYISGNYVSLNYSAEYSGERKDTSVFFYLAATGLYDLDSLATNSGTGSFPQYALNLTGHQTAGLAGDAAAQVLVEGGGGLKPVIGAADIRKAIIDTIDAREGAGAHKRAIINRASLNFHYVNEFAGTGDYELLYKLPEVLSPTCRLHPTDSTVSFMGLTDSSSSEENQGERDLSLLSFNPDITYHAQELIGMADDNAALLAGSYDIWLLIMHNDIVTTTTSGNSDLSDYYQYLAYQSYMSNMYGGYGGYGYGGYGYGGYGSYGYSNYYNYAMLAQMYGQSTTTSSTQVNLDRDRYYCCRLYGPAATDTALRPSLTFTYSIPRE